MSKASVYGYVFSGRVAISATMIVLFAIVAVVASGSAHGQTFTVIHRFSNGIDGRNPGGLTIDTSGNLYGVASSYSGTGNVYELNYTGASWHFNLLYAFQGGDDGAWPQGKAVLGPDGRLYGTTVFGGGTGCGGNGCGTVYTLKRSPCRSSNSNCPWTETVLYRFKGGDDAANPYGALVFDKAGNLYGAAGGGSAGYGTVFELAAANSGWNESLVYTFKGGTDGRGPSELIFDGEDNLYGTTYEGGNLACDSGYGCGVAFRLAKSGSEWVQSVLYTFGDGVD